MTVSESSRPLDRREAAAYLTNKRFVKTSPKYLAKLACTGGGPTFKKYGRRTGYEIPDLDEYADSKISEPRRSTSEAA